MVTSKTSQSSRIKNYTTQLSEDEIFKQIHKILASHGVKRTSFDYDDNGRAVAIEFVVEAGNERLTFRLPARFKEAEPLVAKARKAARLAASGEALKDASYRVVWTVIRDWLDAQMALIDIGASRLEEVFMPYMIEGGQTLFEHFVARRALPPPSRMTISEE